MYWQCECGEKFPELGVKEPGNIKGWQEANRHVSEHKMNGEPERLIGLFDDEGNLIFPGGSRPMAVKQGILPPSPSYQQKKEKEAAGNQSSAPDQSEPPASSHQNTPFRGRAVFEDYPIGPMMYMLIMEMRVRFPERYPDDSPKTRRLIMEDIATAVAILLHDELALGAQVKKALMDTGWVKPVVPLGPPTSQMPTV